MKISKTVNTLVRKGVFLAVAGCLAGCGVGSRSISASPDGDLGLAPPTSERPATEPRGTRTDDPTTSPLGDWRTVELNVGSDRFDYPGTPLELSDSRTWGTDGCNSLSLELVSWTAAGTIDIALVPGFVTQIGCWQQGPYEEVLLAADRWERDGDELVLSSEIGSIVYRSASTFVYDQIPEPGDGATGSIIGTWRIEDLVAVKQPLPDLSPDATVVIGKDSIAITDGCFEHEGVIALDENAKSIALRWGSTTPSCSWSVGAADITSLFTGAEYGFNTDGSVDVVGSLMYGTLVPAG